MPLWDDVGKILHRDLPDHSYTNALDIISAYAHAHSKVRLIERMHEILLVEEARPGPAHAAFCDLPFDVVVTTNFDFLLEKQYERKSRSCTPILSEDQLAIDTGSAVREIAPRVSLVKMHGDLNHPSSMVVTEEDYDDFINRNPLLCTYIGNLLISRTVVLIGYSLDDTDLRQVWKIVTNRLGSLRRPAYAIMVDADLPTVSRYERRGIKVINIPGEKEKYGSILANVFSQIREHWEKNSVTAPSVLRERSAAEIEISTKDGRTNICFVSSPRNFNAYIRDVLFPEISSFGFVPTQAEDVVSPSENVGATIQSLIAKSAIALFVIGTDGGEWSRYEVSLALRRLTARNVLVLQQSGAPPLWDHAEISNIQLDKDFLRDPKTLVDVVRKWLFERSVENRQAMHSEPQRLFSAKEYRASLISSASLIEYAIRNKLAAAEYEVDTRAPFYRLIELALKKGIIDDKQFSKLREIVVRRNEAVHAQVSVTKTQARDALEMLRDLERGNDDATW